jgi:hypothetical protein
MGFPWIPLRLLGGSNGVWRAGCWWLTPVILVTQKAEFRRFEASPGKKCVRPYLEKYLHKKRAGGVAQGVGTEFKPWYHKKKK